MSVPPRPRPSNTERVASSNKYKLLFFLVIGSLLTIGFIQQSSLLNREGGSVGAGLRRSKPGRQLPTPPACPIPQLDPFHKSILHLLLPPKPSENGDQECTGKYPLLFQSNRENSTLFPVKSEADFRKVYGYDSCCYRTVERGKEEDNPEQKNPEVIIISSECFPLSLKTKTEIPAAHEFLAVYCKGRATNGTEKMVDIHAFVLLKPRRQDTNPSNSFKWGAGGREKLNVVIFGLDSVSRMNFLRSMPKSYAFLKEQLGAVEMTGYNIMGDGTFQNLMPMLTSKTVEEQSCTGKKYYDECPFIWKEYSEQGYITSLSEDITHISIFNLDGRPRFKEQPVDYYTRPLVTWADKQFLVDARDKPCYGPRLSFQFLLDYMEKFVQRMDQAKRNFFQLTWATGLTHNNLNSPRLADPLVHQSLKWLKTSGALDDNTLFILMSDHGLKIGPFRNTVQGRLEVLLPFMFLVFPRSFKVKYERAYRNLLGNRDKLFATFDLHETLQDILHLERIQPASLAEREAELAQLGRGGLPRGLSLFLPLPSFRSCKMAGIPQQYCSCTLMEPVADFSNNPEVAHVAKVGLAHINSLLPLSQCALLRLKEVSFAQTAVDPTIHSYLITFQTKPGGGQFQALIGKNGNNSEWTVQEGGIARTNSYGTQSHCVEEKKLKLYCYCNDLLKAPKSNRSGSISEKVFV